MSIRRKLTVFVVLLTVIPMAILLLTTHFALNKQIELNEQTYLNIAMKTARNAMYSRARSLNKVGMIVTQSSTFQQYIRERNAEGLKEALVSVKNNCPYLDYAAVVDSEGNLLTRLSPRMVFDRSSRMMILLDKASASKESVFSEEVFPMEQLFLPESREYEQFIVELIDPHPSQGKILAKALMGTTVVPVISKAGHNDVLGYLIFGDVANHDAYFPTYYTDYVNGSYLALSVDGVRICANINTESGGNYVGSETPVGHKIRQDGENQYFGKDLIDNEEHIFIDENILNCSGESVAVIGIGIPEDRFLNIISNNDRMVLVVTIVCLIIMLIAGNWLADKITLPIIKATDEAKLMAANSLACVPDPDSSDKDEGKVLLETFKVISRDMQKKGQEREEALAELRREHAKQKQLSAQLLAVNEQLEQTVAERTKYLQDAVEELHKVDVAKSRFMANISHELRTPLNVVMGSAEILKDNVLGTLTEKQNKYVQSIYSSGAHLLQLINDILDISKIATGNMSLNITEFWVQDLITQVVDNMHSYRGNKQLIITAAAEPENFMLQADVQKLQQIFYNLLSNAVKFTPEGGRISLKVFKREDVLEAVVTDTGIGIAAENLERVFVEFEQVDNSYTRQFEGTGLGLPLVRKLVELHGGQVFLKSTLGEGTEVMFTIPLKRSGRGE